MNLIQTLIREYDSDRTRDCDPVSKRLLSVSTLQIM